MILKKIMKITNLLEPAENRKETVKWFCHQAPYYREH